MGPVHVCLELRPCAMCLQGATRSVRNEEHVQDAANFQMLTLAWNFLWLGAVANRCDAEFVFRQDS